MEESNADISRVYVTRGFCEKLLSMINDDSVSFADIARLIVFQPFLVARLLSVANEACLRHGSFKRPTTIQGIISILGFRGVTDEFSVLAEAPTSMCPVLVKQATDCYILASVYASIAEGQFGKRRASEHFLAGLIAPLVEKDFKILEGCHEGIRDYFNLTYSKGASIEGYSTIHDAMDLIKEFEKQEIRKGMEYVYSAWHAARVSARKALT